MKQTNSGKAHIVRRPGSCMRCRHRKIRCDGALPVCGPCKILPGGEEDCEYRDESGAKTRTELLEENIARLERRIHELESTDDLQSVPSRVRGYGRSATEPSASEMSSSLSTFMNNCGYLGFFLHPGKFREKLEGSAQGYNTLASSLLNAVYLWGARLAPLPQPRLEEMFLSRVQQCLPADLQQSDRHRLLDTLQAELLVALYYVDTGSSVRGSYHANAAASLAHTLQLSSVQVSSGSRDFIDDGERIYAFWTCLVISNQFAHCGTPTAFHCPSPVLNEVTTPWPVLDRSSLVSLQGQKNPTIKLYLHGHSDPTNSSQTLVARASIIYEWSTTLFRNHRGSSHRESPTWQASVNTLDARIAGLLPNIPRSHTTIAQSPDWTLVQALVQVAIIRRYSPFAQIDERSRDRCFNAAFDVAATVREAISQGVRVVSPLLWVLYALCANVLITHRTLAHEQQITLAGRSAQDAEHALHVMTVLFERFADRRPLAPYIAHFRGESISPV